MDKPLKSVTHGQCNARPTDLPNRRTSLPSTGTKLYCLVTEGHVCEQLGQLKNKGRYLTAKWLGDELATSRVASQRPDHYTTMPHGLVPLPHVAISIQLLFLPVK